MRLRLLASVLTREALCSKGVRHNPSYFPPAKKISLTCWFQNLRAKILYIVQFGLLLRAWVSGELGVIIPVQ